MLFAYAIAVIVMAMVLLASAVAKLIRTQRMLQDLGERLGVPLRLFPFLAACEISGTIGLVIGLWYPPLGIAAAIGLLLYFVGATAAHLRKGDVKGMPNAIAMLLVSATALALRLAD